MKKFDLKEVLAKKDISQYALAQATQVSQANISRICAGKRQFENLSLTSALSILRYLYSEKELLEIIRENF